MKPLHHLTARRRLSIKTSAAVVVAAAVLPMTGTTAVAATSHTFRHGHAQLGKLPAGLRPAPRIDAALAGARGQVTVMLQLTRKAGIDAYLHPTGRSRAHSARLSAYRQQVSGDRTQQRAVAAHFGASATKATKLYTVHAGYNGIAVRTDARRLAALSRLPGVAAVHRIAPLHPLNNVTVPLIKAPDVWANAGVGNDIGQNMTIGIIDTGLDYTHKDFNGAGTPGDYDTAKTNETKPLNDPSVAGLYDSAKFAGGEDLAGDDYDALAGQPGDGAGDPDPTHAIPVPDPNPLDCNSHGTHVAGTAAGYGVKTDNSSGKGFDYTSLGGQPDLGSTFKIGPGVAPGARIFSVKVFGCLEGADTEIVPEAIDALIQQNATGHDVNGNPAPKIDVINMSLGGNYASAQDPTAVEANKAVLAGLEVVSAAGNAGDVFDVLGSPGNAIRGIGVAASDDTQDITDALHVSAPFTKNEPAEESIAFDWAGSPPVTGDLATVPGSNINNPPSGTNNADGCDPIPAGTFTSNQIAYFSWTDNAALRRCGSATRTVHAADAGAAGAVFFDDQDEFSAGITGSSLIPSMLITKSAGSDIKTALDAAQTVTVSLDHTLHNTGKNDHANTANAIATFTSRGDDYPGNLKPDVAAPGQTVFSAGMGTGSGGLSDSGTSMASPHVAGVAALVSAAHSSDPDWSPLDTKAAIVNTATQDVYNRDPNDNSADQGTIEPPIQVGAGRVNALDAVNTKSLAYVEDTSGAVGVSFGPLDVTQPTQTFAKQVRIVNTSGAANTYTAVYNSINDMPGASYSVTPSTPINIPAGGHADVTVTLTAHRNQLIERPGASVPQDPAGAGIERSFIADTSGNLVVHPTTGTDLRVPLYAAPRPSSSMRAPSTVAISGGKGTFTLKGTGIDNSAQLTAHAQPGDALSQSTLDAFELQGTSPALPSCSAKVQSSCIPFSDERAGDLKAVGFASDGPAMTQAHLDPFNDGGFGYFGIQTWGQWHTPASYEEFDVLIDTDGNGGPDAVLFNDRVSAPQQDFDYFFSTLEDLRPGPTNGDIVDSQLIDNTDGSQDLEEFNSDVINLPFTLGALEAVGYDPQKHPRIQYSVDAFTEEEGFTDSIADPYNGQHVMSVDPAKPALMASDVTDNPPTACTGPTACFPVFNPDQPGATLTVLTKAGRLAADKPLGLMLFHYNNAKGDRVEFVKVASTVKLKLSKTTAPFGYRDHATVTVKSGAGTPTGRVSLFNGSTKVGSGALHHGVAHVTLPALSIGKHHIKAVYAGNNLLAGSSASKTLKVTKAKTHTTLSSSPANPSAGGTVTLKAVTKVLSPGHAPVAGTVTFYNGSTRLGKADSHGTATFSVHGLTVGAHQFRAVYGGSSTTAGSSGSYSVAI